MNDNCKVYKLINQVSVEIGLFALLSLCLRALLGLSTCIDTLYTMSSTAFSDSFTVNLLLFNVLVAGLVS